MIKQLIVKRAPLLVALALLSGCMTTEVEVDDDTVFPVPLVSKIPLHMGLHLPDELLDFVYTEDLGDDGQIDRRLAHGYDLQGRLIVTDEDRQADGVVDSRTEQIWGPDGLEARISDVGADGQIEVRWRFVRDAEGHLIEELEDRGDDGEIDRVARWTAECDLPGP